MKEMDWLRTILDGVMMSAYFNLATGLVMVINPVTFTTSYPKDSQKIAPKNPHAGRDKSLFSLLVILPVLLYGSLSAWHGGTAGFWPLFWTGYIQWFFVNLGDFFGLDWYLLQKMGKRLQLPGTEGNPIYERKAWMKALAVPEHWVQWPLLICPFFGLLTAGIGWLLGHL